MTGPAAAAAAAVAAATHNLASVPPWRLSTTVTRARRPADSSLTNTGHLPPPPAVSTLSENCHRGNLAPVLTLTLTLT